MKVVAKKLYSLPVGFSVQEGRSSAPGLRSWRVDTGGRARIEYDSLYPTFRSVAQAGNRLVPPAVPKPFCGTAPFVSRIRSSATGTAASRHTTSITIGLISAAAGVPVAGRPLRSCRGFLCLIHTTAYWLVARHCGGALRSTTA